eukprot:scaffold11596_cov36-Phaeocystis_antarctica.AAC.1
MPGECISMSTARDPLARMRAEAYHSMAYAHGQLCHVSAAVCQVHVLLERSVRPCARSQLGAFRPEREFGAPRGGGPPGR